MSSEIKPYQQVAAQAQAAIHDAIPAAWKLSPEFLASLPDNVNVIDIPRTCGILTPAQIAITEQTLTELVPNIATGKLTSVEVTEAFCARAAIIHQLTNCLAAFLSEDALRDAAALDEHFAKTGKVVGPLHGIPICIKDMYDLKGQRSTVGYVSRYDVIADEDSSLVKVLRNAGAVFHTKTTMPQTGMVLETRSNLFGVTLNPYNRKLASGGSSGGDGVMLAMRGSPISPSSDIGGSIRVPAAFNGLYSIKPSADRTSKVGVRGTVPGNISIRVSVGPCANSVEDVEAFTKILNTHGSLAQYDANTVPVPWRELGIQKEKLSFGLFEFDGICMPHPPILRALRETAQKLIAAGHEVVPITLPFDCWKVAEWTWKLYFQTGFQEGRKVLAAGGEPLVPALERHLEIFKCRELTVPELFACNVKQAEFKGQMAKWWSATAATAKTGRPLDGILAPVHPSTSFPHNFPCWWGYSTLWNILDYPAVTMPVKGIKISPETDPKDVSYKPLDNAFDKLTYDMYDPELFAAQPTCIQVIGRPFEDEELIATTAVIDHVINDSK